MFDRDEDFDRDDEPGQAGICSDCGCACHATPIDCGIGAYEFWGARGVHRDVRQLSPCCEAEVVNGGEKVVGKTTHTARIAHCNGKIQPGQKYQRIVTHHWRAGGPGWFTVEKRVA